MSSWDDVLKEILKEAQALSPAGAQNANDAQFEALREAFERMGLAPEVAKQAAMGRDGAIKLSEQHQVRIEAADPDALRFALLRETFKQMGHSEMDAENAAKERMKQIPTVRLTEQRKKPPVGKGGSARDLRG
jgi:hypothetical protein